MKSPKNINARDAVEDPRYSGGFIARKLLSHYPVIEDLGKELLYLTDAQYEGLLAGKYDYSDSIDVISLVDYIEKSGLDTVPNFSVYEVTSADEEDLISRFYQLLENMPEEGVMNKLLDKVEAIIESFRVHYE